MEGSVKRTWCSWPKATARVAALPVHVNSYLQQQIPKQMCPFMQQGNFKPLTVPVCFSYSKQDFLRHSLQHLGGLKVQEELGFQVQLASSLFLIPSL